ncbi:hypothetical protein [Azospirillum sp. sgz301742]
MGNSPAKHLSWILLRLGLLAVVQGAAANAIAASQSDPFTFEKYKRYDNDTAKQLAGDELNGRFPAGSNLDDAIIALREAGEKCEILERFPDFVFCEYVHSPPGLLAFVSSMEWKVLVYFDKATNTTTHIEVNRGLTGL